MKRTLQILATAIIIILVILIAGNMYLNKFKKPENTIQVELFNKTNIQLSGLFITYNGAIQDREVPPIKAGESNKINFTPQESFGENVLYIKYLTSEGWQKEILVGYFEKSVNYIDLKVYVSYKDEQKGLLSFDISNR